MIKKLAAVTAALTIAICSFTSCSKNNDSSSTVSSTVDSSVSSVDSTTEKQTPEPIDTKDFIVCTIDGKDIDFDTFRYYYYYTISKYTSTYGATLDTIKSTDGGFKLLMEDVITALKQELVAPELAEENGIELKQTMILMKLILMTLSRLTSQRIFTGKCLKQLLSILK